MGINLRRIQHQIMFLLAIPLLSIGFVYLLHLILSPISNQWFYPLIDSVGVLGAYSLIFAYFDNKLWKEPWFRKIGVVLVPDLSGRWKGELVSTYSSDKKVQAFLEVSQSFSKIEVCLYTKTSYSSCSIAGFLTRGKTHELHYIYKNDPNENAAVTMHSHTGTVVLRYNEGKSKLEGYYYNENRHERGFTGKMALTLVSKNLESKF